MDFTVDWLSLGPAMTVLTLLVVLDIIGGFLVAGIRKELSSSVSYVGMLKKVGIFIYIGVGMCFDLIMVNYQDNVGLGSFKPPITTATLIALFYCAHESLSIVEKLARCGIPMPKFLHPLLQRLLDKTDGGGMVPTVRVKVDSDALNMNGVKADIKEAAKEAAQTAVEKKVLERRLDRIERKAEANAEAIQSAVSDSTIIRNVPADSSSDI